MANLLTIRTTVENMMLLVSGVVPAEPVEEKPLTQEECAEAGHPGYRKMLGGHRMCPKCNVKWKESADE